MTKQERKDLKPAGNLSEDSSLVEPSELYRLKKEIGKLEKEIRDIKKVQTPFGLILHNPLIFVSLAFLSISITAFIAYHLYDDLREKQLDLKNEMKQLDTLQKEQYSHYLNELLEILKQKR